jgi:cytochrome c oxidase assembly protein subunit 15
VLAAWTWRTDPRPLVRRLALVALATVILQGTLGGITVLWFLPAPVSIGHAGLAQIFFCLMVTLSLLTSRGWLSAAAPVDDERLRRLTMATTALIYGQILLGATMRHTGAGLAIPDFPLAFGRLVPPVWSPAIAIHFAHRLGAVVVAVAIGVTVRYVLRGHRDRPELVRPAILLSALVVVQVTLGALVVLSERAVDVNSAHVIGGSLVLGTSLVLALRAQRVRFTAAGLPAATAPGVRPAPLAPVSDLR